MGTPKFIAILMGKMMMPSNLEVSYFQQSIAKPNDLGYVGCTPSHKPTYHVGIVEISPIDGKPLMVWGIGFTTLRKYHYQSVPGISSLTLNTCGKTRDNQPILDLWFSRVKVWAGFGDTPVVSRCENIENLWDC